MFRQISLRQALEQLAPPEARELLSSLPVPDDMDLWFMNSARERTRAHTTFEPYLGLWRALARVAQRKLAAGEWLAEGFSPAMGPAPHLIDVRLWRVLELDNTWDPEGVAVGGGFEFVGLLISENTVTELAVDPTQKKLSRVRLRNWIEDLSRSGVPITKEEVLRRARAHFEKQVISDYLFNQAWGDAVKGAGFVQRGRPKNK